MAVTAPGVLGNDTDAFPGPLSAQIVTNPPVGALTLAPNGALNFRMLASLNRTGGMMGQVTKMTSFGRPDAGIPFRITGTTTAPVFVPDAGRVASAAVKDPGTMAKAAGFMKSLFGHK